MFREDPNGRDTRRQCWIVQRFQEPQKLFESRDQRSRVVGLTADSQRVIVMDNRAIWRIRIDGSPINVAEKDANIFLAPSGVNIISACLSPKRDRIAVWTTEQINSSASKERVWLVSLKGHHSSLMETNPSVMWVLGYGFPIWSPDGKHTAVRVQCKHGQWLHVIDTNRRTWSRQRLEGSVFHFEWAGSGENIVLLVGKKLVSRKYLGAKSRLIADLSAYRYVNEVAVSPQGDKIAVTVTSSDEQKQTKTTEPSRGAVKLLIADMSTGRIEQADTGYRLRLGKWSEDGKTLFYIVNKGAHEGSPMEITLYQPTQGLHIWDW